MMITKCDLCEQEIPKEAKPVNVGIGHLLGGHVLCRECGAPVIAFLKEKGLVKDV